MNTIRYQVINPNAKVPQKATHDSAMFDLSSCEDVIIYPGDTMPVKTGLKLKPQTGYHIKIYVRSGMAIKGISLGNGTGIIDADYSGEIMVILHNHSQKDYPINIGHRIAQMELCKNEELRFVESQSIGGLHKGFGSTGQ